MFDYLFTGDEEHPLPLHLALGRRHFQLRDEELRRPLDVLRVRGVDQVLLLLGSAIPTRNEIKYT